MSKVDELQRRVDSLTETLAERDRKDAQRLADELAAKQATDEANARNAQLEAQSAAREEIRKGAWLTHLTAKSPDADFLKLADQIPAKGWPEDAPEHNFVVTVEVPKPKEIDASKTLIGALLK
jgi:hypothetical protein